MEKKSVMSDKLPDATILRTGYKTELSWLIAIASCIMCGRTMLVRDEKGDVIENLLARELVQRTLDAGWRVTNKS